LLKWKVKSMFNQLNKVAISVLSAKKTPRSIELLNVLIHTNICILISIFIAPKVSISRSITTKVKTSKTIKTKTIKTVKN